ncbi:hypothetical protein [Antarcticirhabdus aurantiaca]|uniref:Uncharacterized protein n=1 Tax=Antarcticirhabdus aurantiaca TaxID=2606717 RepID=A0ACD4NT90_9HYPH|nr:hypothetical protein [Antarcticirhabdus aurantiaca]WAJ30007.1 hypothetical protein OXU80_07290 [Jeongeuplla avenae]
MLTQLITKLITGEAGIFVEKMKRLAVLYALMAVCALFMLGFLMNALFVWLASHFGAFGTSLGFALFFLVLVIAVYVMISAAGRPPANRADDRLQRDIASIASVAALSNAPLLFSSVRRRKSLLLVPVAGGFLFAVWRLITATRRRRD